MIMTFEKLLSVKQVAARAKNHRQGKIGVSIQYVLAEIKRGNLPTVLNTPEIGVPFHTIKEVDFLAWEARRAGDE